ncbi:putative phosphoglycerate mutase pmu1, partial [Neodidymelliopsis sp. IMI 364377]
MLIPSHPYKYKVFGIGISIPLFLLSTALIFLFYIASTANMSNSIPTPVPASPPLDFHFEYTVQKGVFMQSEEGTDDEKFDFKEQNFGLIDRKYPTDGDKEEEEKEDKIWKRFERYVKSVVENAREEESYKVLFLGRHGQGWHNVAESKYGTKAWD